MSVLNRRRRLVAEYHREQEVKLELGEEGYTRLKALLMDESAKTPAKLVGVRFQCNRFYDQGTLLWDRDTKLRLRREFFVPEEALSLVTFCAPAYQTPSELILTAKCGRGQQRAGVSDQDEHSYAFPEDERERVWADMSETLAFEHVAQLGLPVEMHLFIEELALACWGSFENERYEFVADENLVCLDRTTFSNAMRDWELEIETERPEEALAEWTLFLTGHGIPWELQSHGKARRLRNAIGIAPAHSAGP
ncbi:MAG: CYTH domain-containing protein [Patescibacteria group bacterium]